MDRLDKFRLFNSLFWSKTETRVVEWKSVYSSNLKDDSISNFRVYAFKKLQK